MAAQSPPMEHIAPRILLVKKQRVILDYSLAELYGVATKALIQAVRRNLKRFARDFMFQLTDQELAGLRSQIVASNPNRPRRGGRRWAYYAFTEQGVAMLSSVLRSDRAIAANIAIMRTLVRMREIVTANTELAKKLDELERRVSGHDEAIARIVQAIRELAVPLDSRPSRRIGFV